MIIITGASSGLGKEVAKLYSETGKTIVNISRHKCEFATHNLLHDLSKGSEIEVAAREVLAMNEPIEAVIHAAGVFSDQPFGKITESEVERTMSTNVKSGILLTSCLVDRLKSDGADILNVVSTAGTKGNPDHPVYAASKWAERGYTQALQAELKKTACRVISFCPGGMKTDFFENAKNDTDTSNFMQPREIAKFIKQILDLPKSVEVSEVIINRK